MNHCHSFTKTLEISAESPYSVVLDIGQKHRLSKGPQLALGIPHGSRRVRIYRAKVAVTVNEGRAKGKVLYGT